MANGLAWSEAETEALLELLGDSPFPVVVSCYRRWACQQGFPRRTAKALKTRAYLLGQSLRPTGQWLSSSAIAELLGRDRTGVCRWATCGWVRRRDRLMLRADVVKLARARPWLFGGCERGGLVQLLEDEALADSILAAYPKRSCQLQPLLCVTTGKRYRSIHAAAAANYIDRRGLVIAMRENREVLGLRFTAA